MTWWRTMLLSLVCCGASWGLLPGEVAVVYNANSPLSCKAMQHYCRLRGIKPHQCIPLQDVAAGEISRGDFDIKIRMALLLAGRERGLNWPCGPAHGSQTMRAMVLMPDLPLRIKEEIGLNGKHPGQVPNNAASVDSELMLLGAEYPRDKFGRNAFFRANQTLESARPRVMSVCRIDAPTEEAVFRMMNDAVKVERTGLQGWVVVDQGGPYPEGDKWMEGVAKQARQAHRPLFHETSRHTLAEAFPLMRDTAVYVGWYANPPNGPFRKTAPAEFKFAPGAIAFHLHSYSATGIKTADSWVGALLQRGAAVTAGNVAEPMLGTCLYYDVFYERLQAGYTVAEAALMATPVVSWQGIVLGDPLYRPYARRVRPLRGDVYAEWQEACRRMAGDDARLCSLVESKLSAPRGALWSELYAWFCANRNESARAAAYFAAAAERYGLESDIIRTRLLEATCLFAVGHKTRSESILRGLATRYESSPYAPAIRQSLNTLFPPPPPPKPQQNQQTPTK
ncbi:MAG: TIGR03790 family protein [Akkermansia sp.]|nr:TIGR03790 family protein [Akkermansia sp.]